MRCEVLLFAQAAEILGVRRLEIEVADGATAVAPVKPASLSIGMTAPVIRSSSAMASGLLGYWRYFP